MDGRDDWLPGSEHYGQMEEQRERAEKAEALLEKASTENGAIKAIQDLTGANEELRRQLRDARREMKTTSEGETTWQTGEPPESDAILLQSDQKRYHIGCRESGSTMVHLSGGDTWLCTSQIIRWTRLEEVIYLISSQGGCKIKRCRCIVTDHIAYWDPHTESWYCKRCGWLMGAPEASRAQPGDVRVFNPALVDPGDFETKEQKKERWRFGLARDLLKTLIAKGSPLLIQAGLAVELADELLEKLEGTKQ